jgi:hypothetical protein
MDTVISSTYGTTLLEQIIQMHYIDKFNNGSPEFKIKWLEGEILDCQQLIDAYKSDKTPESVSVVQDCEIEIVRLNELIDNIRNNKEKDVTLTVDSFETNIRIG